MIDGDLILMAAPTGARRSKMDHENLPITPEEIAAEARRCMRAGAAVIHLHVRDKDGAHSLDPGRYAEALDQIRTATGDGIVAQVTSESLDRYTPDQQIEAMKAVKREAVSVSVRDICPGPNEEPAAFAFFQWLKDNHVWPQFILYDADDALRFKAMMEAGSIPFAIPYVLYVLGRFTPGQVSMPSDLYPYLSAMSGAPKHRWGLCAFGPGETACVREALERGGDARVGFENNMTKPDGKLAAHTSELVDLAREAGLACGRRRMDADALRQRIPEWIG